MKLRWIRVVAALLSWFLVMPASAKNSVYKGLFTTTDLFTGEVQAFSTYLVLGDERPLDPAKDTYAYISGTFVLFGPPFGKKRYTASPAGLFRTLERTVTMKGKPRTAEIISRVDEALPTDSGDGGHVGRIIVLSGVHTSPKYDTVDFHIPLALNLQRGRGFVSALHMSIKTCPHYEESGVPATSDGR